MERATQNKQYKILAGAMALAALGILAASTLPLATHAADEMKSEKAEPDKATAETPSTEQECCQAGDNRPPLELVEKVPPGQLHSPYPEYAKLAKEEELVKQFRLPGCNECHGGTGGGGFCPALSQGVWFWGNTDDVLFRLITLGSVGLEKQGFQRIQFGSVPAPMPPMAVSIKSSDQLWKIIAFIRSINPPGTNPPAKVVPGRMTPAGEGKKG
jgi:mono/diheme cytochrome c family protein